MTDLAVLPIPSDPLTNLFAIPNPTPHSTCPTLPLQSSLQQPFVQSLPDTSANRKLQLDHINQNYPVIPSHWSNFNPATISVVDDTTQFTSARTTDTSQSPATPVLLPIPISHSSLPLQSSCMSLSNTSSEHPTIASSLHTHNSFAFATYSTTAGPAIDQIHDASASLTAVIQRALRMPSQHSWICGLLVSPQTIRERVAHASPFQHACAPLISLPITSATPSSVSSVLEQILPTAFAQGSPSHLDFSQFHCALTPLLSRDAITLCAATNSQGLPIPAAFDNRSAELFLLPDPNIAVYITPCVNAATVVIINFAINGFQAFARSAGDFASNQRQGPLNIGSYVHSATVIDVPCTPPQSPLMAPFQPTSVPCGMQAAYQSSRTMSHFQSYLQSPPQIQAQRVQTVTPSHPLDFSVLARNVAALTTNFTVARVQTCSDFNNARPLWRHIPDAMFSLTVATNAQTVAQWAAVAANLLPPTSASSAFSSLEFQQCLHSDQESISSSSNNSPSRSQSRSNSQSQSNSHSHSHSASGEDSYSNHESKPKEKKKSPASMELRKIRNRESAARSNLRRKLRTEALKGDLLVEKQKLAQVEQRRNQLMEENILLKKAVSRR